MSLENRKSISVLENSPPVITSTCCVGLHCCSQTDDTTDAKIHRVESIMNMLKQVQEQLEMVKKDVAEDNS